ncbi:hypothetical protein PV04_04483 [Phialophora macrospora]|uniref:Nitrate reductase [NADPH] n=1 Tax=Phialophora macrospora TaxID=1851006 RepID=A0A0D2G9H2_9EURO|nr:hypothetical protein PV04_04483 [Phialophora macrospora]
MPLPAPRCPYVRTHPGSSEQEIADEPDWGAGHNHRIGYRNRHGRFAGLTHEGDHDPYKDQDDRKFVEEAMQKHRDLRKRAEKGDLLNFQDVARGQTDFYSHRPDAYPPGWRVGVDAREDWVKHEQDWPANIRLREKQENQRREELEVRKKLGDKCGEEDHNEEHDWRRDNSETSEKHHGAYSKSGGESAQPQQNGTMTHGHNGEHKTEYQKLRETYSPEEITLLRLLQYERDQTKAFQQNDGRQDSPLKEEVRNTPIEIDAIDAMTPDNWIPRSSNLVRNTGQHPMNAEPRLDALFSAGLVTPNNLHYVRNHASVPRLLWDTHTLDVCDGTLRLSMDDLKNGFEAYNIQVALGCDGNRRGELNLIKKSKGFSWGPGAISCAYWKGAMLYDVLSAAGVDGTSWNGDRQWVNFEGADEPSEGKYATSIPLDYVLDRANDVMLAYEMNNSPLPPDHGFPVRVLIPGFVGGRSVKWLSRIWITDHENESYYHIWDNRVLPSFITEKDGEFARTMFNHPSTACMEQNLNSVIVRPGQGETLDMADLLKCDTYRVRGFAYDGGGHEVQRVELSLDNGATWLYCIRHFPDLPVRNGRKFWTWVHWHVDIDSAHLARAESLTVRCFNVFKNTQPQHPVWNLLGMMNNGWYVVKLSVDSQGQLLFRHPYHQEGNEGWMTPSMENQLAAAKQDAGIPDKQFTRQEIESHASKDDAWLVINGNVYDVTSVLAWHPGGTATILANAGKLSPEVTSAFESIHDDYAHKKLQECVIGRVSEKAETFMREQAKAEAEKEKVSGIGDHRELLLQRKKWVPVKLVARKQLSSDTFAYTFSYKDTYNGNSPSKSHVKLGLGTCQHIQMGIHMLDKLLIRSYTPTRPIIGLTSTDDDADDSFELTVKTYFPDENQPGGAFSNFLHELPLGQTVEANGPTGEIKYMGNGRFDIEGKTRVFHKINLILGGSGVTPGYALLQHVAQEDGHTSDDNDTQIQVRVLDANKSEQDILLREQLRDIEKRSAGRIQITHVISHTADQDQWGREGGLTGHINAHMIRDKLFPPALGRQNINTDDTKMSARGKEGESAGVVTFLCGPPSMIQKAALPALRDWGFVEDEDCFGF